MERSGDTRKATVAQTTRDRAIETVPGRLAILAVLLAAAALGPGVAGDFFFSDAEIYISKNEALRTVPLAEIWRVWQTPLFREELLPLRDLVYRLEMAAFGLEPIPYKVVNLLLLMLGGGAAWIFAHDFHRRFPANGARATATTTTAAVTLALWIAHPSHVESVAWAAGLKDLLGGALGLAALCAFQRGLPLPEEASRLQLLPLAAATLLFIAALMSKVTVAPVAGMALLLATAALSRSLTARRALAKGTAAALPLLAVATVAVSVHAAMAAVGSVPGGIPETIAGKLSRAVRILGAMYQMSIAPYDLRLTWDVYQGGVIGALRLALAALGVVGGLWGAWAFVFRRVPEGFGLAAALGATVPVLHLIPFDTWSLASERHLYWPVFGIALAAGSLAARLAVRRGRTPRVIAALALASATIAGLGLTLHRSLEWHGGPERLLVIENEADPSWATGAFLRLEGDPRAKQWDVGMAVATPVADAAQREMLQALVAARRRVALAKRDGGAPSAIAEADRAMLDAERAVRAALNAAAHPASVWVAHQAHSALSPLYEELIELAPDQGAFRYNLALIRKNYLTRADQQGAERQFIEAIRTGRLPPAAVGNAWDQIAIIRIRRGDLAGARQALINAVRADPRAYQAAYRLLALESRAGNAAAAAAVARQFRERARATGMAPREIAERIERAGEVDDLTRNRIVP